MPDSGMNESAPTGIAGLDTILGGGVPFGQLCLIHGESGAGKTTLSLQFLLEGARNRESVLYVGTSETEDEIRRIARSHDWSLEGVRLHHHATSTGEEEQTMLHPAELELPRTIRSLLSIVDEASPTRLVIDSLTELRVLARDELWYRRQLMALKQHFDANNCTVLVTEIPSGGGMLNTIVNSVIELEQESPVYGADRRRLRVAKARGRQFETGYHDYKILRGGLDVFPRVIAAAHRDTFSIERISTGLPDMDVMLDGGLIRGTSVLLLGPSGTGKSLVATQLAVAAAARDERVAFFVFDERVQTLLQRAEGVGLPFEQYVADGLIELRQVDPAELTAGEFSHVVKRLTEDRGIRMLIIDSLNGYAYAMPEERLLGVYLHELSSYLSHQAVTPVFTMTQHGMISGHVDQPFDISYISDTVALFRHFEFGGQIHKAVSVYKSRSSRHESAIHELTVDSAGIHLGEPLTQFQGVLSGSPVFTGDALKTDQRHGKAAAD